MPPRKTCVVEPGIVLDELNRQLRASGLWFPVDVSTSSRATIGGMTGNNSCGTRSIRYGIMRDNVIAIDAHPGRRQRGAFRRGGAQSRTAGADRFPPLGMADGVGGSTLRATPPLTLPEGEESTATLALFRDLLALGRREAEHIAHAFPDVTRRVGGYLIDALVPRSQPVNLATLLCGSEGTLAVSRRIELEAFAAAQEQGARHLPLRDLPPGDGGDAAHRQAGPVAVEVVDRTLIELARDIAMFRPVMEAYVRGKPDALLLVEFAEDDQAENLRRLDRLDELMGDLGHPAERGQSLRRRRPEGDVGGARLGPQHHDVDEERG